MPHMKPMMWILTMVMSASTVIMMMIMMYYSTNQNKKKVMSKITMYKYMNKW